MACACKVSQQLSYIEQKYGTKTKVSKKTSITTSVRAFFGSIFNGIATLILTPFMLVSVLISRRKVIKIDRLFGIANHERHQQNI